MPVTSITDEVVICFATALFHSLDTALILIHPPHEAANAFEPLSATEPFTGCKSPSDG